MLSEHRKKKKQCALHSSLCFKAKQMRHDMALCEMILTCQLLVGNWSDLHANGLRLLNDVGGSGTITGADVHGEGFFFFSIALLLDFCAE